MINCLVIGVHKDNRCTACSHKNGKQCLAPRPCTCSRCGRNGKSADAWEAEEARAMQVQHELSSRDPHPPASISWHISCHQAHSRPSSPCSLSLADLWAPPPWTRWCQRHAIPRRTDRSVVQRTRSKHTQPKCAGTSGGGICKPRRRMRALEVAIISLNAQSSGLLMLVRRRSNKHWQRRDEASGWAFRACRG